ncbi:hypothetical protein [Trichormus variabilis]|uniref:Uncharacterized protein n=1 Tax=Trichormus variabilis SAG 1403-4b TaxID=447716 RepID=A0A433UGN3_ANAVA|nr:hypothetical protein [Trichormus variabilis]MBD2629604.1 hypothetical protein [Trichormus variabilis FACHB-164]RUS92978.1 hypothetical protein DSM107003_47250 [Trichormus variabilis SAG 1403-4b]
MIKTTLKCDYYQIDISVATSGNEQMLIERPLVVKQLAVGGLIRELFLVPLCLDVKGQGVEEWEAEIDDRVAHLYGLTAEEMKIIREG